MKSHDLASVYSQRASEFSALLSNASRNIRIISNARLLTALLFLAALYFGLTHHTLLYTLPLLLFVFVILIRNHGKLFDQKTHLENLVKINQMEQQALLGNLSGFQTGSEFTNPHHPYSHDLDIFGDGSLFQHVNRCNTIIGKKRFAHRLENPLYSKEEITIHQNAIKELADRIDFRQHFQAAGMEIDEQPRDREQLLDWLRQPSFLYGKQILRYVLIVAPVITVALVVGWTFSPAFRPFAILMAIFQWVFLGFYIKRINTFHDYISRKKNILQKYSRLLHYLQHERFTSTLMEKLSSRARSAGQKVGALASLVHALDARLNSMTTLIVNSLLLYDLQCVYRLEKWKEENKENLHAWLEAASETEVLVSFGTFASNRNHFVFPSIQHDLSIQAESLGHPLISHKENIANDFAIGNNQQILIITGANMAGKSTFLRTVGVNLVLALSGAPVCAEKFSCPIIQLRTGMRTADSLKDHQSYFYAELDRLKGIMEELRRNIPLLVLLDEILKGTNSTDKQAGSIALVKQLLPHPCLAIIATHDLALGDLEKEYPQKVKNYSFEATIENDQLSFDYKLKPGLAQKMNATFLMKKMGIIPS
jgi:DNA mismatch repair ATPase MutS